jgi:hypothetical protein
VGERRVSSSTAVRASKRERESERARERESERARERERAADSRTNGEKGGEGIVKWQEEEFAQTPLTKQN